MSEYIIGKIVLNPMKEAYGESDCEIIQEQLHVINRKNEKIQQLQATIHMLREALNKALALTVAEDKSE